MNLYITIVVTGTICTVYTTIVRTCNILSTVDLCIKFIPSSAGCMQYTIIIKYNAVQKRHL